MNICKKGLLLSVLISLCTVIYGQSHTDTIHVSSAFIPKGVYDVIVVLPAGYNKEQTYPILYSMDWILWGDMLKSISDSLQNADAMSKVIIVGIELKNPAIKWGIVERSRDFTPEPNRYDHKYQTGGAAAYQQFLKEEVIKPIEKKYKSDTTQRTFLGGSLSGLYGAYVIYTEPSLFKNYIIGSPSLRYNNYLLSDAIIDMPKAKLKGIKQVILSLGSLEDEYMQEGFECFRSNLAFKGVKVKPTIYPNKTHVSVNHSFLLNGMKLVFGMKGPKSRR